MIRLAHRNSFYFFFWLAWATGLAWLYFSKMQQGSQTDLEVCIFKRVTALPCPSCGSTHAALSLLSGDWHAAWEYNPLGILIVAGLTIFPLWALSDIMVHKQTLYLTYCFAIAKIRQPSWAYPLGMLFLLNWIWNIAKTL